MSEKIRVLIVDDLPETRENVRKLLQFEPDVEVVAQAGDGSQAIVIAQQHQPDVILMDINMPGQDGISASQAITRAVPAAQIIIMSVQSEADYLRRAMLAGARDFLMKPFSGDELMAAIRRVYETRPKMGPAVGVGTGNMGASANAAVKSKEGKIISVFSPKGGSGCTTIAINLAIVLATRGYRTVLVDASLQFGDVAVTLNLRPTTSIIDLVDRINELDNDFVSSVLVEHSTGLRVLLAPQRPEMAEHVKSEHMEALLKQLSNSFDYIIVDTSSALNDITLSVLDVSDKIFLVAQQNLASLTNMRRFFDLLDVLEYDSSKIILMVNRSSEKLGISVKDVSEALKRPIIVAVPSDDIKVTNAADRGQPIAATARSRRDDVLVNSFNKLADSLEHVFNSADADNSSTESSKNGIEASKKRKSFLGNLFSR